MYNEFDFVQALRHPIHRYLSSLLKDEAEAEAVLQEVWLLAHSGLSELREPHAEVTWLYRIATHAALAHLRSHKCHTAIEPEVDVTELPDDEEELPTLTVALERKEMGGCVQRCIEALPDNQRTVLLLSEFEDLTGSEVAETLGITLGTAKFRLHRARSALRDTLASGCQFCGDDRGVLVCEPR